MVRSACYDFSIKSRELLKSIIHEGGHNMKRKMKHMGLIMGAAMMAAVTGASPALAADRPVKTQKPAATSAPAENKEQGTKTDQKEDPKKGTLFYGKVKKLEKDKIVVDEAVVLVEMDTDGEKKSPDANAENKETNAKNAGTATSVPANFETETMKWTLVGKTLEFKTEKETKYMKSISEDDTKTGDAAEGTANGKKAGTSGKSEKTDQKGSKAASSEGADTVKSTAVDRKDLQEGMFLKVTVKDDGSLIASEVLVLSDVKEIMPAGQEGTDKAGQTGTKKDTEASHS